MSNLLRRAHYVPAVILVAYAALLVLMTIPAVQREFLFLHHIPIPLFPDFDNPQKYGLGPFKTRNIRLNTSDGVEIGAWHVLPRRVYETLDPFPPHSLPADEVCDQAFSKRPTILYFHGNAGNRATSHRVRSYSSFSTNLDCNVLVIDYRGFGDSHGTPTEEGLMKDARAAHDFVADALERSGLSRKEVEEQIILVGQSLGTGVVSGLAGQLASEDIKPRALVLIAPFSSITELVLSYRLLKAIPLLGPLNIFPAAQRFFQSFLLHPFNSIEALEKTSSPTLILHAINDNTIPYSHSARLFTSLLDSASLTPSSVKERNYRGWGTVRSVDRGDKGEVVWWEGQNGGHDNLGWAEGTIDLIARIANL
ncbi:hypothetical protein I302_102729 [Kwoniella bestiolae CBS 10118]|uniref:AB hydrolase-1 domain-containing protein n=1 Tax=Kwoniella bestiolae CBS 10118 TaxID=1296100 RepID=A0A1B9GFV6_9TREE|nr:hypothetical protein I302_01422 [Kwoniella bestiolae CBS 10118]OCF29909.1 hypothetical protein I302_01422 [Kwoniella bestiolae CBS 10118]